MTTRTRSSRALVILSAGLLAFGLAACSSGSDDPNGKAFCRAAKQIESQSSEFESSSSDQAAAMEAMQKLVDTMNVDAPKDISADWKTVKETFSALNDALKNMDATSTESVTKVQDATEKLKSDDYKTAADKVDKWTSKNC